MAFDEPMDRFVEQMRSVILKSDALFGFVYDFQNDGPRYSRGRAIWGYIRDETILRQYFKPMGELSIAARAAGANRSTNIGVPTNVPNPEGSWYACVITQNIEIAACVVAIYQFEHEAQARSRVLEFEAELKLFQRQQPLKSTNDDEKVSIDRILETCAINRKNAILVPGFPTFLRYEDGLHAVVAPPITTHGLANLIDEITPPGRFAEIPGLRQFDLRFGATECFRIAVLGAAELRVMIVTRLNGVPSPLEACMDEWSPVGGDWVRLLRRGLAGQDFDALAVIGAPPMTWGNGGVSAVKAPVLTNVQIRSNIDRTVDRSNQFVRAEGFIEFGVCLNGERFRAAMFGHLSWTFVLYMREARTA